MHHPRTGRLLVASGFLLLIGVSTALAVTEIRQATSPSGAGESASGTTTVRYSAGQSAVLTVSSANVTIQPGFWSGAGTPPTAIGPEEATPIARTRLHQNAPNPFNPATTIAYEVPNGESHVHLGIYTLGGRLVRTLVDGVASGGRQQITWRGRDDSGRPVASGTYVYTLDIGRKRLTRKLTLVR